jgi:Bacterial DNA-binding protein
LTENEELRDAGWPDGCRKASEGIEMQGFGSFTVRQYRAYDGRNPRTGAIVPVKPKRLALFKVGNNPRERVNNGKRSTEVAASRRAIFRS